MRGLLIVVCLVFVGSSVESLHCYVDKNGIKQSDDDEDKVDVNRFRQVDCSSFGDGKVK